MKKPTREEAYQLFRQYNESESLITHALAVEGVMLHFAHYFNAENPEKWGIIGLVHDIDYEKYPEEHCKKVIEILQENDWSEEYIRAVVSHGWKLCNNVEPRSQLEKTLYTIDELTGLITATALMRPSKSILDLKPKSVKKKWKQKSFAAGVKREVIAEGAQMLGMELNDVIAETIKGMQEVAEEIGLKGEL